MAEADDSLTATAPDWRSIAPEDAGFAPDLDARLDQAIRERRVWNLHAVLVARAGRVVLERYYEGEDQDGPDSLGRVAFGLETLHDLRSVSKSIVGLCYGIALAEGKVPGLEDKLFAHFPEYADLATAGRERGTIGNVVTMTLGSDWDELSRPYSDPLNSEIAMELAPDRYRYVLGLPIIVEPGTKWIYNGGATALLGRLIAKGTGRSLPDYARGILFDPLGLGATEWRRGNDGEPRAASGLRMKPRDLARVGQMVMAGGVASGRQVVPAAWLERSLKPAVRIEEARAYGFHWYLGEVAAEPPTGRRWHWIGAIGNGGQRLYLVPELELVVAITTGNYNKRDQGLPPLRVMREVVLANVT